MIGHALGEAVHPHARWVVGDARLLVVAAHPPRPEPELEPAPRQHVEGGRLLGQHDGMAVVVVEDERADPQRRGGVGRGHEGGHRCQLVAEMVGHEQRRVPEVLGLAGLLGPGPGPCRRAPSTVGRRSGTSGDGPSHLSSLVVAGMDVDAGDPLAVEHVAVAGVVLEGEPRLEAVGAQLGHRRTLEARHLGVVARGRASRARPIAAGSAPARPGSGAAPAGGAR